MFGLKLRRRPVLRAATSSSLPLWAFVPRCGPSAPHQEAFPPLASQGYFFFLTPERLLLIKARLETSIEELYTALDRGHKGDRDSLATSPYLVCSIELDQELLDPSSLQIEVGYLYKRQLLEVTIKARTWKKISPSPILEPLRVRGNREHFFARLQLQAAPFNSPRDVVTLRLVKAQGASLLTLVPAGATSGSDTTSSRALTPGIYHITAVKDRCSLTKILQDHERSTSPSQAGGAPFVLSFGSYRRVKNVALDLARSLSPTRAQLRFITSHLFSLWQQWFAPSSREWADLLSLEADKIPRLSYEGQRAAQEGRACLVLYWRSLLREHFLPLPLLQERRRQVQVEEEEGLSWELRDFFVIGLLLLRDFLEIDHSSRCLMIKSLGPKWSAQGELWGVVFPAGVLSRDRIQVDLYWRGGRYRQVALRRLPLASSASLQGGEEAIASCEDSCPLALAFEGKESAKSARLRRLSLEEGSYQNVYEARQERENSQASRKAPNSAKKHRQKSSGKSSNASPDKRSHKLSRGLLCDLTKKVLFEEAGREQLVLDRFS